MKRINILQMITAVLGLAAVLLVPYYKFSVLGVPLYQISAINGIGGMYPIFVMPVLGMLILVLLSFDSVRSISIGAGAVLLVVQIVFVVCRKSIILSGDIAFLLNQASGLVEKVSGASTKLEIQQVLAPLLNPDWGFYVGAALNLVYIIAGLLFNDIFVSGGSSSAGRRSSGGNGTASGGRRSF